MKVLKKDMTQELLKRYLHYDEHSGYFTWVFKHCKKVIPGTRAGSISSKYGHRVIHLFGSLYPEHRLAWLYMTGHFPIEHVDHINHNECDNSWNNLREVSQQENNMNQSKRCDNNSGITGIWIRCTAKHKKFVAEMHYAGKRVYYKTFATLQEAILARKEQEHLYGFHENHGIIKPL